MRSRRDAGRVLRAGGRRPGVLGVGLLQRVDGGAHLREREIASMSFDRFEMASMVFEICGAKVALFERFCDKNTIWRPF